MKPSNRPKIAFQGEFIWQQLLANFCPKFPAVNIGSHTWALTKSSWQPQCKWPKFLTSLELWGGNTLGLGRVNHGLEFFFETSSIFGLHIIITIHLFPWHFCEMAPVKISDMVWDFSKNRQLNQSSFFLVSFRSPLRT